MLSYFLQTIVLLGMFFAFNKTSAEKYPIKIKTGYREIFIIKKYKETFMKIFSRNGILLIFATAIILVACDEQDKIAIEKSASVFDIEQGKASIQQSNLRFMNAFKDHDSVEVANCFTKNSVIMIDGFPSIEGRDAIKHFFSQVMANDVKKYDLATKNIWGDSSILVEEGIYKLTGKEKKEVGKGKYIVLWKQESGNWKMFRDIWARDFPSTALIPGGDSAVVEIKKKALHFF